MGSVQVVSQCVDHVCGLCHRCCLSTCDMWRGFFDLELNLCEKNICSDSSYWSLGFLFHDSDRL